jgi:hypothetical protein
MHCFQRAALVVAFVVMLTPLPAAAASLGLDITGGPEGGVDPNPFTIGWGVTVINPVRVTALGVWDEELDGLLVSHAVGLWTATGTLITSTTVPAGTAADTTVASTSGVGRWLFEDIADVILQPGNYVLGSTSAGDDFRASQNGVILDPNLASFDGSRFHFGANLQFPEQNIDGIGFFGPNFLLEPVPVTPTPLPASLALVGLGLLGWGVRQARRRSSR